MAYNDAYNFPKIYHMISVSNREIEGKIFNMISSFTYINSKASTPLRPCQTAIFSLINCRI